MTVPAGLGARYRCELLQVGAGRVTVVGVGATINSLGALGVMRSAGQFGRLDLFAYADDAFIIKGDLD